MGDESILTKEWILTPEYGNEKKLMLEVSDTVLQLFPNESRIADIQTVVAEACINAIEHGSNSSPIMVRVQFYTNKYEINVTNAVMLTKARVQEQEYQHYACSAQLWEKEHPRGWGLLFIRELTDYTMIEQRGNFFSLKMIYYVQGGIR